MTDEMRFGGQEMLLLFLIVLLLFGAARLPRLARSLREARDEFQKESSGVPPEAKTDNPEPAPPEPAPSSSESAPAQGDKPAGLQVEPEQKT
jgi:sec-independent protein translocase protein TatA